MVGGAGGDCAHERLQCVRSGRIIGRRLDGDHRSPAGQVGREGQSRRGVGDEILARERRATACTAERRCVVHAAGRREGPRAHGGSVDDRPTFVRPTTGKRGQVESRCGRPASQAQEPDAAVLVGGRIIRRCCQNVRSAGRREVIAEGLGGSNWSGQPRSSRPNRRSHGWRPG